MMRIEPELVDGERIVVRLLRRYAACRHNGEQRLPSLTKLGSELGMQPPAVIALASVFQLTEACLGRSLITECCCNRALSSDERALLILLALPVDSGLGFANTVMPHGLPGALAWAIASTRRLLDPSFPLL